MLTQTHTRPSGAIQFEGLEKKTSLLVFWWWRFFPDKDERDVTERDHKFWLVEGQSLMVWIHPLSLAWWTSIFTVKVQLDPSGIKTVIKKYQGFFFGRIKSVQCLFMYFLNPLLLHCIDFHVWLSNTAATQLIVC